MSIGTTAALVIGGTALAGAGISAGASLSAAGTQADAANNAANLQAQEAQKSLDFQKQEWQTQQANLAPWLKAGTTALSSLNGGTLPSFEAPTGATEQNDPGYQFRLQQGQAALENSAAAKGGLIGGNEGEALTQYGQNYASNEYQNVYNRAMNNYQTNVLGPYNRLSSLAGLGQQTATTLGQEGQSAASGVTNINLTTGAQQGQDIQNAAAARASGYVGAGNAIGGGISGIGQSMLLSQLLGNQQTGQPFALPGSGPQVQY
jgi:hypothetical protein